MSSRQGEQVEASRADKSALRRTVRARRRERDEEQRDASADGLLAVARAEPALQRARAVTAYLAVGGEPDLTRVLDWLAGRGCVVWLPVVTAEPDGTPALHWAERGEGVRLGEPTGSGARLPEPCGPTRPDPGPVDVVLLPGLAVDLEGTRLGQGGGYYDRTVDRLGWGAPTPVDQPVADAGSAPGTGSAADERVAGVGPAHRSRASARPLLVAVVHDDEVLAHVPAEAYDTRADAICTPSRWLSCRPEPG